MNNFFKLIFSATLFTMLTACGGDTQKQGELGKNNIYVDHEGNSGNFTLNIENKRIDVGRSAEVVAIITDRNGLPVQSAQVSCYSEDLLAVTFSPNIGHTGDRGGFSTELTCNTEGSWRVFCYAVGGNLSEHATIVCQ